LGWGCQGYLLVRGAGGRQPVPAAAVPPSSLSLRDRSGAGSRRIDLTDQVVPDAHALVVLARQLDQLPADEVAVDRVSLIAEHRLGVGEARASSTGASP
jgi:hypothetical protein